MEQRHRRDQMGSESARVLTFTPGTYRRDRGWLESLATFYCRSPTTIRLLDNTRGATDRNSNTQACTTRTKPAFEALAVNGRMGQPRLKVGLAGPRRMNSGGDRWGEGPQQTARMQQSRAFRLGRFEPAPLARSPQLACCNPAGDALIAVAHLPVQADRLPHTTHGLA